MSRVLLLGGTGVMGARLRTHLVGYGHDVYVTTRRERDIETGVRFVRGDAQDDDFLMRVLQEVKPDAVVDFMSYSTEKFAKRKDALLSGTGQYVFLSSGRVFAGEEVHTERSPRLLDVCDDEEYLSTDEYALAKARCENILRDSGQRNWTIVRPAITYAASTLHFGCLWAGTFYIRALQGLPVPIPVEMLQKRTTLTSGADVAVMLSRLVLNHRAIGEDFNVTTAESHTWMSVAEFYRELIGMQIQQVSLSDYCRICDPWHVKYGRMLHHVFDNSKVLAFTDMKQSDFLPLKAGLEDAVSEMKGMKIAVDLAGNARIDRVLGTRINPDGWRNRLRYWRYRYPLVNAVFGCVRHIVR